MKIFPPAMLSSHAALVGKSGSGKTYTVKLFIEELLEQKERVFIIDPTGVYWGLKSSASGKGEGFPVIIFGGDHADVNVGPDDGAAIAEIIGTSAAPAILDVSLMTPSQRTRLFTEFANTIMRTNKGPLHLIIDEAHLFAPQGRVDSPQSGMMLHAANNLVSLGRARGLRVVLITQRPAKIHKDSLTQVETLIAMRLIAPQDRNAIKEWVLGQADVERGNDVLNSLASMPTGQGWIWSPEDDFLEKIKFPKIKTFDSSSTPDSRDLGKNIVTAKIDIAAVQSQMQGFIEEKAKTDPSRLTARIAELEKQLSAKNVNSDFDQRKVEVEKNKSVKEGENLGFVKAATLIKNRISTLIGELTQEFLDKDKSKSSTALVINPAGFDIGYAKFKPPAPETKISATIKLDKKQGAVFEKIAAEAAVMQSLAFWEHMGNATPTRKQVAAVAGYSPTSGSFGVLLGKLVAAGKIEYPRPGLIQAADPDNFLDMTSAQAKAMILSRLDAGQTKVAEIAAQSKGAISRKDLGELAGYSPTSGSFGVLIGSLIALDILRKHGSGTVMASDWFLEVFNGC